jgi:hypothetical protein
MATTEEKVKILKLIEDGKISADQGVQLLEALQDPRKDKAPGGLGLPKAPRRRAGSGSASPTPTQERYG